MLVHLIAFGLLTITPEAGTGDVDLGPRQTAAVKEGAATGGNSSAIPLNAVAWTMPLDPSDLVPYAYDWSSVLDNDEKVAAIERITMSATGAAVGVEIEQSGERAPIVDTGGKKVQIWLSVAEAFQSNSAFSGTGIQVPIAIRISTDATPPRYYERSAVLTVRQQ